MSSDSLSEVIGDGVEPNALPVVLASMSDADHLEINQSYPLDKMNLIF